MRKISGIYKISNVVNGKFYIGSTNDIHRRWGEHESKLVKGIHTNDYLQNSFTKHTKDNFTFEILEECECDKLLVVEQQYLDSLQPFDRDIGFNISEIAGGGDIYSTLSDEKQTEFKKKCRKSGEANGMYGKTHTDKTIKLQKEKSVGRYTLQWYIEKYGVGGESLYEERRASLANRDIEYTRDNKLTGVKRGPMSEDHKLKISQSRLRMKDIEDDLKRAIVSRKYTIKQMEVMFGISKPTILNRKRRYL